MILLNKFISHERSQVGILYKFTLKNYPLKSGKSLYAASNKITILHASYRRDISLTKNERRISRYNKIYCVRVYFTEVSERETAINAQICINIRDTNESLVLILDTTSCVVCFSYSNNYTHGCDNTCRDQPNVLRINFEKKDSRQHQAAIDTYNILRENMSRA